MWTAISMLSIMRFFLIDRITRWEAGASAEARKNVALSEDFFDDHFPRRPVMPGVLILEGMAQLSGLLLEASLQQKYAKNAKAVLTVLERTKFRSLVKPGDSLTYHAELLSVNEAGGKVKASAHRSGSLVTSTQMVFAFKYVDDPQLDEKRRRLMEIWLGASATLGAPACLPARVRDDQVAGEGVGAPGT
jgi:3-hydroxyacyl-[acyl-carrier-protein] dehydratase